MSDPNDALKTVTSILNAEPVKNLLSPVTKEVGELLGALANLARFYMTDNLERIFTKWAKVHRTGHAIEAEAFKKIMPLLPLASMVSDDELQEKWAVLMESTATQDASLPSFAPTLSQLTPEEAQYLDRLWKLVLTPTDYLPEHRFGREPLSHSKLMQAFDPNMNTGLSPAERRIFDDQFTDQQKANYERVGHAELVIQDLIRLGIIVEHELPKSDVPTQAHFSFSQYGVAFMQAVTAKDEVRYAP